jgi:hypothetical protein
LLLLLLLLLLEIPPPSSSSSSACVVERYLTLLCVCVCVFQKDAQMQKKELQMNTALSSAANKILALEKDVQL